MVPMAKYMGVVWLLKPLISDPIVCMKIKQTAIATFGEI